MENAERLATRSLPRIRPKWLWAGLLAAAVVAAVVFAEWWWPPLRERIAAFLGPSPAHRAGETEEGRGDAQGGHDHEHGHGDPNSIEISPQARRNIGLVVDAVKVKDYDRTLSIPGIVVQKPGQSRIDVTAPLTGRVVEIYVAQGQAVAPGQKLFDLRLTHEEVVQAQTNLLRTAEELKVIRREVERLREVTRNGAIAGKSLLEREYEQQKLEAVFKAEKEALRLHGLSEAQVDEILKSGRLLPLFTVEAPQSTGETNAKPSVMQLEKLLVNRGQNVKTGDELAILTNHSSLLIEGRAFEQDGAQIVAALEHGWKVSAVLETQGRKPEEVKDLELLYVSNQVDAESRALHFYVDLPNTTLRDPRNERERYPVWRFKPGQRMQIRIPVERWEKQIVLPIDAVAQDGVETFVFRENGDHFDRQPVSVIFRDPFHAVIAADGSLFPGERIALNGAHQLLVALKNKSGGGADPHVGHQH